MHVLPPVNNVCRMGTLALSELKYFRNGSYVTRDALSAAQEEVFTAAAFAALNRQVAVTAKGGDAAVLYPIEHVAVNKLPDPRFRLLVLSLAYASVLGYK